MSEQTRIPRFSWIVCLANAVLTLAVCLSADASDAVTFVAICGWLAASFGAYEAVR